MDAYREHGGEAAHSIELKIK